MCDIQFIQSNNTTYAKIIGDLDKHTVQFIRRKIDSMNITNLVIDLSEINFLDDYGVGLLMYCKKIYSNFKIIDCSKAAKLTLQLCNFPRELFN